MGRPIIIAKIYIFLFLQGMVANTDNFKWSWLQDTLDRICISYEKSNFQSHKAFSYQPGAWVARLCHGKARRTNAHLQGQSDASLARCTASMPVVWEDCRRVMCSRFPPSVGLWGHPCFKAISLWCALFLPVNRVVTKTLILNTVIGIQEYVIGSVT